MNKLVRLAETKLGCGYVWGAQGEHLTASLLEWFKRTFGASHYVFTDSSGTKVDAAKWIGKQCFDCSGLVLWCLQQLGFIPENRDYSADMFKKQLCTAITKGDLQPGDLCFIDTGDDGDMDHIAIYAGNGMIVHAKGTRYGVVKTKLDSGYDNFGRLKFEIGDDQAVAETPIGTGTIINISSYLNVRSGPGTSYTDVGDLYNGNVVPVYEEKNSWYRIGVNKWISGQYVKYVPATDRIDDLVEEMLKDGLITDAAYWEDVLRGKIPPKLEYLEIIFNRATTKIV